MRGGRPRRPSVARTAPRSQPAGARRRIARRSQAARARDARLDRQRTPAPPRIPRRRARGGDNHRPARPRARDSPGARTTRRTGRCHAWPRNRTIAPGVDRSSAPGDPEMTLPRAYEDQLVERAKQDAAAFGELYDHYFGQIYRFVFSRLRDQEAAEDVTSEVFFKDPRAIGRYKPSCHPFSAWLYQISVNAIPDPYRAKRPAASLDDASGVADPARPVDERVVDSAEAARVWEAIDDLPPQQRAAMTLKLGEDLKLAQIGEILGKSEGAVKLLIHRGMIGVRMRLGVVVTVEEKS